MPRTPNVHHVRLDDGRVVLYSYQTPVAIAYLDEHHVFAHDHRYSVTTTRHIFKFAKEYGFGLYYVPDQQFANLLAPLQSH